MGRLHSFFNTPARQALGWTLLGIVGIAMAAGGVWFLTSGDDGTAEADAEAGVQPTATQTPTATGTATGTQSATTSPAPTETPTPTPIPTRPATRAAATGSGTGGGSGPGNGTGTGGSNEQPAAQEPPPTPEPAAPAGAAGGPYCPPSSVGQGSLPSGRVAGAVKVGGADAGEGTVTLYVAFDGVLGPSRVNHTTGGFNIDFWASSSECANRVGAAVSVYANGQYFSTGRSVGDGGGPLMPVTIELP